MRARAALYRHIRQFFDARDVLEVDTPILAHYGVTDLHIDCIPVAHYGYLQSSPEYHMKRLLAAGSGPIWRLGKVFRDGESGRRHNPEFTLLEWYRPGFDLAALMQETVEVARLALPDHDVVTYTFRDIFANVTGLDPLVATPSQLDGYARRHGNELPDSLNREALVDWLMATEVEAAFNPHAITLVQDFPPWAAALADMKDVDGQPVANRFELYAGGYEIANGYQELRDAAEQQQRFDNDQQQRLAQGKMAPDIDPWLMAAMQKGLPFVSGVALGIERLLMAQLGVDDISKIIAFPWRNA